MDQAKQHTERILKGGAPKYHEKLKENRKLFARDRLALLLDSNSFVEDGMFANCQDESLPADAVVTGLGKIAGRPVAVMANDSTVKAGSWGKRTVEKIVRIQETAARLEIPLFYLVDSAGARITDQVEMFPGRRGAGRIFYQEANLSGKVPQICLLFGPSAAGGAYIPAFCDLLIMVQGNASMYLGSPRMAEMVIGEKVSLEEMGGAKMHCSVSGCGDILAGSEQQAIEMGKKYISYLPNNYRSQPEQIGSVGPDKAAEPIEKIVPESATRTYDMKKVIRALVDCESFFEIKPLFAPEVIVGFARLEGNVVGIVANQPMAKGGVLFVDSSDKAARFVQVCEAYNIPLLFLADVPGFMIGSQVEKSGMIRAGAKMIYAISRASVPKISVIVRKAYGAGLYAMCGPSFGTDVVIALPTAELAVMGPEPAVNAVYFNKLAELDPEKRKAFREEKIAEYRKDIDLYRLAGELIVDHVVSPQNLRGELSKRYEFYATKARPTNVRAGILPM